MTQKIVFVHNANSGFMSMMIDGLHKNFKPSTYQCQLCSLTWGRASMKQEWKEFTKSLPYPVDFLHKDQLNERWPDLKTTLPAVFIEKDGKLGEIITTEQFDRMTELEDLMKAVTSALK